MTHCTSMTQLVHVVGLPANCSEENIRYFFENRRRSAGAPIEDLVVLPDKVVITFSKNDSEYMLSCGDATQLELPYEKCSFCDNCFRFSCCACLRQAQVEPADDGGHDAGRQAPA